MFVSVVTVFCFESLFDHNFNNLIQFSLSFFRSIYSFDYFSQRLCQSPNTHTRERMSTENIHSLQKYSIFQWFIYKTRPNTSQIILNIRVLCIFRVVDYIRRIFSFSRVMIVGRICFNDICVTYSWLASVLFRQILLDESMRARFSIRVNVKIE